MMSTCDLSADHVTVRADTVSKALAREYRDLLSVASEQYPQCIHWCAFGRMEGPLRSDGHPMIMAPLPDLPYPRRMWAGGRLEWLSEIEQDEPLTRTSRVISLDEKTTRHGDAILLCKVSHVVESDRGDLLRERQDIVLLPEGRYEGRRKPDSVDFEIVERVERRFDNVDLFRFSALTRNTHRIHYDLNHATDAEGYPGLVVHGPFLASCLCQLGADATDGQPIEFVHRAVRPVFAGEPISFVRGRSTYGSMELAALASDGGTAMRASMRVRT